MSLIKETSTLISRFCANHKSKNFNLESKYNELMTYDFFQNMYKIQYQMKINNTITSQQVSEDHCHYRPKEHTAMDSPIS